MKFFIVLLLALVFYSCNECRNLDCVASNYTVYLRLLKQPGDNDLLFGPTALYHPDSIRFYMLNGSDTTFFPHLLMKLPGSSSDSMLSVTVFPAATSNVYLQLEEQDTDTIQVGYKRFDSKCCGIITQIDSIRYNNYTTVSATEGTIELSK